MFDRLDLLEWQLWLLIMLAQLSLLIAISRVGLGLHHLSDVIASALIGTAFAWLSLQLAG